MKNSIIRLIFGNLFVCPDCQKKWYRHTTVLILPKHKSNNSDNACSGSRKMIIVRE